MCFNGHGPTDVHGMRVLARTLLEMVIWKFCSGLEPTDAHGMTRLALTLLLEDIWTCCNGLGPTDVRGLRFTACRLLTISPTFCSGSELTNVLCPIKKSRGSCCLKRACQRRKKLLREGNVFDARFLQQSASVQPGSTLKRIRDESLSLRNR